MKTKIIFIDPNGNSRTYLISNPEKVSEIEEDTRKAAKNSFPLEKPPKDNDWENRR